jgi:hypothetical protein
MESPIFQPRGCEDYFRLLVAELLRVVLEVGRYLGKEPSEAILIASVLSRYIDLGLILGASQELQMLVVDLELLDLGIKLLNELPKLGLGQGHSRRLSVK